MEDEIEKLVESNGTEREIQNILKFDLHILGHSHSLPKGEYICLSELPVGTGKCDFVVLSSCSRMQVTFIEVKGADVNFLNKEGTVSSPVKAALTQIEERLAYVERNYESFRRNIHQIRESVFNKSYPYNAVLCDKEYLGVDPNKDIYTNGIVIAGRTVNDGLESQIKWNMEKTHQIYVLNHGVVGYESIENA